MHFNNQPKTNKFLCGGCQQLTRFSKGYYAYKEGYCVSCFDKKLNIITSATPPEPIKSIENIEGIEKLSLCK